MKIISNFYIYFTIFLVVASIFCHEAEARRKILRGRKTITRTYYKGTAIPAWSIVLLVGLGMAVIGGVVYVALSKVVLSTPKNTYSPPLMRASQGM